MRLRGGHGWSAHAQVDSQHHSAPREEVQPIRIVVERRELVPKDSQRLLGLLGFEHLEELLLPDLKAYRLCTRVGNQSAAPRRGKEQLRRTVKSKTSFGGSSSSSFSTVGQSPASTPLRKSVTVLDSSVKPDSAERESAVSLRRRMPVSESSEGGGKLDSRVTHILESLQR